MFGILYLLLLLPSVLSLTVDIEYNLIHSSRYMFSTGLNNSYIINSYDTLDICKKMCDTNSSCLGLTSYYYNNSLECNLLSNLGDTMSTSLNISSYRKLTRYYNNDKYSIYGTVDTSDNKYNLIDTDVYIDMNHNGVHDPTEPITTSYNGNFNFTNLREGKYLIKEVTPPECTQLFPGVWGNSKTINGDGYADNIIYIHKHNHKLSGGYINSNNSTIEANFIIGNKQDSYMSFYPKDEIILSFVDETIIDTNGYDIFINVYKNSSTQGHISVSNNGLNFTYIGIINSTQTKVDLGRVNYTGHVSYIKLHFFGGDEGIDIMSVQGSPDSLYSPSFGYYIKVPLQKSIQKVIFINDCHYHYDCILHCFLGNIYSNNTYSCLSGCNLFKQNYKCECEKYLEYKINYTNDFSIDKCYEGCEYKMTQFFFPDYKVYKNSVGSSEPHHIINSINMEYCNPKENSNCLLNMRDICKKRKICQSISIDNENLVNYNNIERYYQNGSYLLVKNKHIGSEGLDYLTSTSSTSTLSTSSTSTLSSRISPIINSNTKSDKDEKIKIISIISGIIFFVVGTIIIFAVLFCRNSDKSDVIKTIPPNNNKPISFENPVYDRPDLYQQTLPGEPMYNDDYIDVE